MGNIFNFQFRERSDSINEAMGKVDNSSFLEKATWLRQKWHDMDDSEEKRLACSIVFQDFSSLDVAIIVDNVEFFKTHYKEKYNTSLKHPLALACFCGSEKIADFLLEQLEKTYISEGYDFVLSYASASNNISWIKTIACNVADKQKEMPDDVLFLCKDSKVMAMLTKIFHPELFEDCNDDKPDPEAQVKNENFLTAFNAAVAYSKEPYSIDGVNNEVSRLIAEKLTLKPQKK